MIIQGRSGSKRIPALESWRGIMAMMIFILHICPEKIPLLAGGGETISFFIILSGFGLVVSRLEYDCTLKDVVGFTVRRIKRFWPLHMMVLIALMLISCSGYIISHNINNINGLLTKFFLSATMIQSFIPKAPWYYGLNGVAWYLSTSVVFYLSYIPIQKCIKGLTVRKTVKMLWGGVLLHFLVIVLLQANEDFTYWTYIFPPFRLIEFILGMFLGHIFLHRESRKFNRAFATVEEILVIAVFLMERVLCKYTSVYEVPYNYQSAVAVVISVMIVYVFSQNQGMISKWLSNSVNTYLGKISFEIYLLHTTILEIWYFAFSKFIGETWKVPFIAITTLLLATAYHKKIWRGLRLKR